MALVANSDRLATCNSYFYPFFRVAVVAFVDYLRGGRFCFFSRKLQKELITKAMLHLGHRWNPHVLQAELVY